MNISVKVGFLIKVVGNNGSVDKVFLLKEKEKGLLNKKKDIENFKDFQVYKDNRNKGI